MESTFVAVDLETTGLNPERDSVIEMAGVRFGDGRVLAEFETFVQSDVDVPLRVRQLTGLSADDLQGAPDMATALDEFVRFIGDDTIVGHSAGHDVAFLRRYGVLTDHPVIDTFELASILVPEAARYSVGHLVKLLELEGPDPLHRALADAHAHRLLFQALVERARRIPADRLQAIARLAAGVDWPLARVFIAAAYDPAPQSDEELDLPEPKAPLRAVPAPEQIDVEALAALIAPGGPAERRIDSFEDRPGQRHMLTTVGDAFNHGGHVMVEAGTGIGKSIAYLLPAAAWAVANRRPVVVSTHTLNLQDQLVDNDVPVVEGLLAEEVTATVLKGRANYLCRTRLQNLLARTDLDVDGVRAAAKILVWDATTHTGDRSELMLHAQEQRTWQLVSAGGDACTAQVCPHAASGSCWLNRARAHAAGAHIIIVNHALLVSDMVMENRLLPRHTCLIIDEAHHLEAAATQALAVRVSRRRVRDVVSTIAGSTGGLLALASAAIASSDLDEPDRRRFAEAIAALTQTALDTLPATERLFGELETFLEEHAEGRSTEVRLTEGARAQPGWLPVELAYEDVHHALGQSRAGLSSLAQGLVAAAELVYDVEALMAELGNAQRELAAIDAALTRIVSQPHGGDVLWARKGDGGQIALHAAPVHVGGMLFDALFADKDTLVLTSATLRAGDDFEFLRDRLSLPDAVAEVIESPFDYSSAALLCLPTDLPEPNQPQYQPALDQLLLALTRAAVGKTLVLYTAYSGLRRSYKHLLEPLGKSGIRVLGQGIDGGRRRILEEFRDAEYPTVLLGTRSFWEGIDVPGESLSCLAITRLPFDVPTEPVFEARAETFDDPFRDYALPIALLRFRQGFGRLIRSGSDRGVVAILDGRIRTRYYGRRFLDVLPPCQRYVGPLHTLPGVAERFLRGESIGSPTPSYVDGPSDAAGPPL